MSLAAARLSAALAAIEDWLDQRGAHPGRTLAWQLRMARELPRLVHKPWIALVGRRGAGKSSLLNALAGAPLCFTDAVRDATSELSPYELALGEHAALFLDTPGLRAGGALGRAHSVASLLRATPPDVLLFLHPAPEVDAGVDAELADLALVLGALPPHTPVLALATRVDELAPPDVPPPFDDPDKALVIKRAVTTLHRHLLVRELPALAVLPVCTALEFAGPELALDLRWNLAALRERLLPLVRALPEPRERASRLYAELLAGLGVALGARLRSVAEVPATLALLDRVQGALGLRAPERDDSLAGQLRGLPGRVWSALQSPGQRVAAHGASLAHRVRGQPELLDERVWGGEGEASARAAGS